MYTSYKTIVCSQQSFSLSYLSFKLSYIKFELSFRGLKESNKRNDPVRLLIFLIRTRTCVSVSKVLNRSDHTNCNQATRDALTLTTAHSFLAKQVTASWMVAIRERSRVIYALISFAAGRPLSQSNGFHSVVSDMLLRDRCRCFINRWMNNALKNAVHNMNF